MDRSLTESSRLRSISLSLRVFGAFFVCLTLLLPAAAVRAAGVTMTAKPMLGGNVRPGSWAGFRIHLENDGPTVSGELHITGGAQGDSSYGTTVELPTGARQDQLLYAQPNWFSGRLVLSLVSGANVVATQNLSVSVLDPYTPTVVVVAEHPEGIVGDLRSGVTSPQSQPPSVLTIKPSDLPPRVEAWSAIDRLVWQDSDSGSLSTEQRDALSSWVSAGGDFVIVGGTTGTTGFSGLPAVMLPFVPTVTVDASVADLTSLLGTLPAGARASPAIAGILDHGSVLARSGNMVIAAQAGYGQGTVTIVGVDPSAHWLAGSATAISLWRRILPPSVGGVINPLAVQDDSQLVAILNNLPSVDLPKIEQLFVLLLAYIALIGPINYLVLRRLDKREWAWVTMPTFVVVFAVAAYALGLGLKGTDVIVNEVGIVRGATGSDRGLGQYYIGVFSPNRQTFDVRVAHGALLSNPTYLAQQQQTGVPLDVVQGDPSHLRGYQVGFGVLRSFRAEAAVKAAIVDADLTYSEGHLRGTISNRSDRTLEQIAVIYGGNLALVGSLDPGTGASIDLDAAGGLPVDQQGVQLSQRIFGVQTSTGSELRTQYTRRIVIDALTGYSGTIGGYGAVQNGPIVLAWDSGAQLHVDVDTPAQRVGDTLLVLPAQVKITGPTVFSSGLMQHSILAATANEASDQGSNFALSQGTMNVEFRPIGFSGAFETTSLSLMLTQGEMGIIDDGTALPPLPAEDQPDQTNPVGTTTGNAGGAIPPVAPDVPAPMPPGKGGFDGVPELQLFDRVANKWVEFPHFQMQTSYTIPDAARYVDASGSFIVRFVNRDADDQVGFSLVTRLEGTVR